MFETSSVEEGWKIDWRAARLEARKTSEDAYLIFSLRETMKTRTGQWVEIEKFIRYIGFGN